MITEIRQCEGCSSSFACSDPRKKRCRKNCGRSQKGRVRSEESRHGARKVIRDEHILQFVGVDGEGVTNEDGTHDYVLLTVGDRALVSEDGLRLTWEQIFNHLWAHYADYPESTYVGFYLGYDFTQWLRTIPKGKAWSLLHKQGVEKRKRKGSSENPVPYPVWLYGEASNWEVDILGEKRFKLRPLVPKENRDGYPWLYVCDAGPFFQSSFLTAINPAKWPDPIATDEEYALILEGKERRSTAVLDEDMMRYNAAENAVLAKMMCRVNEGFVRAGIRLKRNQWYGPGQAAQAWLDLIEAPTAEAIQEAVPDWALDFARCTYYGGWFEIMGHGHVPGLTYEYDVNSAYPHIISTLPCLLHGKWKRGTTNRQAPLKPGHLRMVKATLRGRDKVTGCMPHRLPDGNICRPKQTTGWFWWHELMTSRAAGLLTSGWDGLKVHEWVEYTPCPCSPPFDAIRELYQDRIRVGKDSPEGKGRKNIYNSAYGKFAQSIGQPKYANSIYASLITAGCRTMILEAIATHPTKTESLVMVATDGVYFREPHPGLDIDATRLGAWDVKTKTNLTLFMPGVYWDDKTRKGLAEGVSPELKSRGVSAKALGSGIASLDEQFHTFIETGIAPSITLELGFAMISAKQGIVRDKWETAGTLIPDPTRILTVPFGNHKRHIFSTADLTNDKGMWRSQPWPWPQGEQMESAPYSETFGMEAQVKFGADNDSLSDDGQLNDLIAWMFGMK